MMNTPDMHLKNTQEILEKVTILKENYLQEWKPLEGEAGWAIAQVFADMAGDLNGHLQQVPHKLFLSFLDALNFTQSAPLFATAPVTFTLTKGFKNSVVIPEGTELLTKDKKTFETNNTFSATSAKLTAMVCVDPISNSVDDVSQSMLNHEVITLFDNTQDQQYLYFGDDNLFNIHRVKGDTNAYIDYTVSEIESQRWEYWGKSELSQEPRWITFEHNENHLNKDKTFATLKKEINGVETYWIRVVLAVPKKEQVGQYAIAYKSCSGIDGLYYNAQPLNPRKKIYPFGKKPHEQDTFYIASSEAFSKKGALCGIAFDGVDCSYEATGNVKLLKDETHYGVVSFEYYNGKAWKKLIFQQSIEKSTLNMSVNTIFYIPEDLEEVAINGDQNFWIRLKLVESTFGTYVYNQTTNKLEENFTPPSLKKIDIYVKSKLVMPQHIFRYAHKSYTNLQTSSDNLPYSWIEELDLEDKSLYLGFDKPFDEGLISMLISVTNAHNEKNIPQYFFYGDDGWQKLLVQDETEGFSKSAIVSFVAPLNQQAFEKFNKKLYWLKISFTKNLRSLMLKGIYLNTVVATQCKSIKKKLLGSSDGSAFQTFSLQDTPAVSPIVWVRESSVEDTDTYYVDEYQEGYWVQWQEVESLNKKRYKQRVYSFDTHSATVMFGDNHSGMIPPLAKNNILISYKTGGGSDGNVDVGKINKLVSSLAYVDKVINYESAAGGSDEQSVESLLTQAPQRIKHAYNGVTKDDFNALVKEASSNIAKVKCFTEPGKINLMIIPHSQVKKPLASLELKKQVLEYVKAVASATAKINVIDPLYAKVDVHLDVVVSDWSLASTIKKSINESVEMFLHPLKGGLNGDGWSFGSVVKLSDIFNLLAQYDGISYVESAAVILDGDLLYDMDGESIFEIPNNVMIYSGDHKINIVVRSI